MTNNIIPSLKMLQNERKSKKNAKDGIYKIILKKCVDKIVEANRFSEKTYIFFTVPELLLGYSDYNSEECVLYIIKKLKINNYMVELFDNNCLYIDWGSSGLPNQVIDKNKLKKQTEVLLKKYPNAKKVEYVYK